MCFAGVFVMGLLYVYLYIGLDLYYGGGFVVRGDVLLLGDLGGNVGAGLAVDIVCSACLCVRCTF